MKKIIVAACAAFVALGAFAMSDDAHTANHKWVRKYVAEMTGKRILDVNVETNGNGSITYTSPFASTNIPDAVSISMTFSENTNAAVRLDNSTIPGMTNRVYFVLDPTQGAYVNASNAVITRINAPKVDVVTVTTNYPHEGCTDCYYAVTNHEWRTAYAATATDGTAYTCYKTNGVYWLQAVTNAAWKARITRTKVSDARRIALIGTPPAVAFAAPTLSFSDIVCAMFVPSAYADVVSGSGIGDDGSITWSFTLDSLTLKLKNKDTVVVDVSDLTFEYSGQLPKKPDDTHTCIEFDEDCNCVGAGLIYADIENSPEYDETQCIDFMNTRFDFSNWMTEEIWQAAGGEIHDKFWQLSAFSIEDGQEFFISPDNFTKCDAWAKEVQALTDAIGKYLADCQYNYKKSKICDQTNPQHSMARKR